MVRLTGEQTLANHRPPGDSWRKIPVYYIKKSQEA
jgi:hypothetical protein